MVPYPPTPDGCQAYFCKSLVIKTIHGILFISSSLLSLPKTLSSAFLATSSAARPALFVLLSVTNDDCAHPVSLQKPFVTGARGLKMVAQYLGPLLLALKQPDAMMKRRKKKIYFFPLQTLM